MLDQKSILFNVKLPVSYKDYPIKWYKISYFLCNCFSTFNVAGLSMSALVVLMGFLL
jgi:hypothetical protein